MHPPNCGTEQGQVPGKSAAWDSRQATEPAAGVGGSGRAGPGGLLAACPGARDCPATWQGTEPSGPTSPRRGPSGGGTRLSPSSLPPSPLVSRADTRAPRPPSASSSSMGRYEAGGAATADSWGCGSRSRAGRMGGRAWRAAPTSPSLPCSVMSRPSTAVGSGSDLLLHPGVSRSTRPRLAERSSQGGVRAGLRDPGCAPTTACPPAGPFSLPGWCPDDRMRLMTLRSKGCDGRQLN